MHMDKSVVTSRLSCMQSEVAPSTFEVESDDSQPEDRMKENNEGGFMQQGGGGDGSHLDSKAPEEPEPPRGLLSRVGGGLWGAASGTVGLGVGSVKWVAGAGYAGASKVISSTYNVTTAAVKKVPVTALKGKDKKE